MTQQNTVPQTGLNAASSAFAPVDQSQTANTVAAGRVADVVNMVAKEVTDYRNEQADKVVVGDHDAGVSVQIWDEDNNVNREVLNLSKIAAAVQQGKVKRGTQARSLAQIAVKEAISRTLNMQTVSVSQQPSTSLRGIRVKVY